MNMWLGPGNRMIRAPYPFATGRPRVLHHDEPNRLATLRAAVARIETGGLGAGSGRHRPRGRTVEDAVRLGEGALRLDVLLGGGLGRGTLHEIVAVHRQDDGAASGFATALAARCARMAPRDDPPPLVWIVEDCAAGETGVPYRAGFASYGLDPDRLVLVRTRDGPTTLWACEEALRLKAPVVVAQLWTGRHYGLAPSRRLLLAARAGRGTALLLHTGLSGHASALSSAAEPRFAVAACPSLAAPSAGRRRNIPGPPAFAVRLLKQRLCAHRDVDVEAMHALVWNPTQRCFDDHPVPFGLSAPLADRQAHAAQGRREPAHENRTLRFG